MIESRPSQTKIVATIGPASSSVEQLVALMEAGVDVFRLNMAHGEPAVQEVRLAAIRTASETVGRPVAVLTDLAGPKMRLGEIPGDQLICNAGERVRFVRSEEGRREKREGRGEESKGLGTSVPSGACFPNSKSPNTNPQSLIPNPSTLTTTYEPLLDELAVGDRVLLADGTVSLEVVEVAPDYAECRVVQPGVVRSRQGVNLPGVKLSVQAMSDIDRTNAVWAAKAGIDFVGLSFVRKGEDVRQLKSLLAEHNPDVQVIAKIEKPEALEQLEEIVAAADGVMVARGDLGVEIDIARVAVVQKNIIAVCNRRRKPVIVATQMLDSMTHSRIPTRAEVADVSNAILDGADACMLSGETAVGEYPREAVEMMHRIALEAEGMHVSPVHWGESQISNIKSEIPKSPSLQISNPQSLIPNPSPAGPNPITEATVSAAGHIAEELGAKIVVVATASGSTALSMAKNRHVVPTLGVSDSPATLRRLCLYWGVIPLAGAPTDDSAALLRYVVEQGRAADLLHSGDRIVLVAGTGLAVTRHNMIVVHELD
jgi:pyruvate kinase